MRKVNVNVTVAQRTGDWKLIDSFKSIRFKTFIAETSTHHVSKGEFFDLVDRLSHVRAKGG